MTRRRNRETIWKSLRESLKKDVILLLTLYTQSSFPADNESSFLVDEYNLKLFFLNSSSVGCEAAAALVFSLNDDNWSEFHLYQTIGWELIWCIDQFTLGVFSLNQLLGDIIVLISGKDLN